MSKNFKQKKKVTVIDGKTEPRPKSIKILFVGVVLVLALFAVSLFILFVKQNSILSISHLNVTMGVGDYIGLNKDTDKLHMGTTFPGGRMYATVNVSSLERGYVYVTCSEGNEEEIMDWLYISNQGQEIKRGETITLLFEGRPGNLAEYGKYESMLHIYVIKNKKNSFVDALFIKGDFLKTADSIPPPTGGIGGKISISIVNQTSNNS